MVRSARGAALAFLVGCGADEVSKGEARDTFDAVNSVADDVVSAARRSVEGAGAGGWTVEGTRDGLHVDGVLTGGERWSGAVAVTGDVEIGYGAFAYALTVTFDGVEAHGATLDGEITVTFYAEDLDFDTSLGLAIAIDGALSLTGGGTGWAEIGYDLELHLDGLRVTFAADGDISGHDVSGWASDLDWSFAL